MPPQDRFWARLFRSSADETHRVSKFARTAMPAAKSDRRTTATCSADTPPTRACEIKVRAAYPSGKSARWAIIRAALRGKRKELANKRVAESFHCWALAFSSAN